MRVWRDVSLSMPRRPASVDLTRSLFAASNATDTQSDSVLDEVSVPDGETAFPSLKYGPSTDQMPLNTPCAKVASAVLPLSLAAS